MNRELKNNVLHKAIHSMTNKVLPKLLAAFLIFGTSSIQSLELDSDNWNVAPGVYLPGSEPDAWETRPMPFNARNEPALTEGQEKQWAFTMEKSIVLTAEQVANFSMINPEFWVRFASNVQRYYFNDRLLYSRGFMAEDGSVEENGFIRNFTFSIPTELLLEGENKLRIILEGHVNDEVYFMSPVIIDSASSHVERNKDTISIMLCFLYAFLGFYHLLLYVKRRKEDYNLWFGLFTVFLSAYIYTRSNTVFNLDILPITLKRWEYLSVAMASCLSPVFFVRFFRDSSSKFARALNNIAYGYAGLIILLQLSNLFRTNGQLVDSLRLWQMTMPTIMLPLTLTIIIRSLFKKNGDAWRLSVGMIVLVFTITLDLLGAMGIAGFDNLGLSTYGFLVFVIGIAFVLANRFLRVHNEVEMLNEELDKKVKLRTEELNETLTKVQALKDQQDGDYFLTSLLLRPLGTTAIQSDNIEIKSFLKQKKDFKFRNKSQEIGGDINVAHNLQLKGRDYVLFLNGDAMGKSIQGAGGALVLGTVFQSIVERTKASKQEQNIHPERWLKDAFAEMHKVFSSFDGSMLMSIVMALVDIKTGTLFFINAEHPFTVLYRDGKASFLEEDVPIRKLGTTIITAHVNVKIAQLEAGDAVVLGSDGRDDLDFGIDDIGQRIINEDETLFLEILEESKGDLEQCFFLLKQKGGITDDTSLLMVTLSTRPKAAAMSNMSKKR